ncbi:hypothetical protein [Stackebrandtia albiflava]|nr:hypothetical protein [Stackebrandtia albiflava]
MTSYRTKDGKTVRDGDMVWAVNGNGPYEIVGPMPGGRLVYLEHVSDSADGLHFEPGDFAMYICANRPAGY